MVGGLGRKSRASLDLLVRPSHPPPHHHLVGFSFSSNLPLLVLRAGLLGRGAHDPVGHRVVPIQNNCRLLPILLVLRKSFGCTIAAVAVAAVAPTSWSFGPLVLWYLVLDLRLCHQQNGVRRMRNHQSIF